MNKKITSIIATILFIALLFGAYLLYNKLNSKRFADQNLSSISESQKQPVEESENEGNIQGEGSSDTKGSRAPDFCVYDRSGKETKLSAFFGKPTVLNFWASWCGPCKHEMPFFEKVYSELGDKVNFVMVNMTDGQRETVSDALAEAGKYSFPVYFDSKGEAAITYSVYSIPATYFIDSDGNLVAQATGAIDEATLLRGIEMIKNSN